MAGILNAMDVSSRGLTVQRARMNVTAENLANAETTKTPEGGPYRRRRVIVSESDATTSFRHILKEAGTRLRRTNDRHFPGRNVRRREHIQTPTVEHEEVTDPASAYRLVHDPTHPQADEHGYVKMPDIEIVHEMVDMMAAARAYEANTVAIATAKQMAKDALDI